MKKIKFLFALAASSFALPSFAQADWPNKPIQIIVTFAPGGTSDVLARAIAPDLSKALGQPVLVVNKPGANSTIATREVARAAPDGYTIGLFISAHASNPHITKSLPYDTKKDFIGYKGGGPALTDLLAGHIQMLINSPTSTIPHVKSGKLRPIATTGATRPEALKDIPTIAESGFPGFELYEWYALFLPAGTPKPIIDRLHAEVMKVMASPAMVKRIAEIGAQSSTDTPQQFAKFLDKEDKVWGDLVKQIGIKPE